jgi:secondary thiamine-phosphate synthase enzyme
MKKLTLKTGKHTQFLPIDHELQTAVEEAGVVSGLVHVFVPHTTAGLTINENADPAVMTDIEMVLDRMVPWEGAYRHDEGNTAAHVKAGLLGFSQTVFVENGRLALGTWQSVYFCEFDGPRTRQVWVKVVAL